MLKNCVTPRMLLMHVLAQPRVGPPSAHPWPSALPHWALPSQLRHAHPQKVDLETQHTTAGLPCVTTAIAICLVLGLTAIDRMTRTTADAIAVEL